MQFLIFLYFFCKINFYETKDISSKPPFKKKKECDVRFTTVFFKNYQISSKNPQFLPSCYSDKDIKGYYCESDILPCKLRPKAT